MSTTATSSFDARAAERIDDRARRDQWFGVIAGLAGGLGLVAVLMLLRPFTDGVSVIDVLADASLLAMPISVFSYLLELFGTNAKTLFLVGLITFLTLVGGWLGWRHALQTAGARRPMWVRAQGYAVGLAIALGLLYMLLAYDATGQTSVLRVMLAVVLASEAWAVVTVLLLTALRTRVSEIAASEEASGQGIDRRQAIALGASGAVALGSLAVIVRDVARVATRPTVGGQTAGRISPAITPVGDFYTISKNFIDPNPDRGEDWGVEIEGLVERPGRISRSELEVLAGPDFVSTLTCISNEVGGPLIGTARWSGAPLAKVFDAMGGVRPNAVDLVAEGEDGYTDSIPIDKALAQETHIVWEMNGEPLIARHGTPVRLIVPGLYGIKNVKWLTKLRVVNEDYRGYWQDRGWTESAVIKTQSRFDVPGARDVLSAGTHEIGGIAFAGDRGISKVEVSLDDGDSWGEATIAENPSDAGLSWVVWTMEWQAKPGSYQMAVRATDGEGNVQTEDTASPLPDGASGYHRIRVGVA